MLLSMTGFGSAGDQFDDKEIQINIRAINSKIADVRFRIPQRYAALEIDLRKRILDSATRGKLEVTITSQGDKTDDDYEINLPLFKSYYRSVRAAMDDMDVTGDNSVAAGILRIYNVVQPNVSEISSDERHMLERCLDRALDNLEAYRQAEGKVLAEDLTNHCHDILSKLKEITPHEEERKKQVRTRLLKSFDSVEQDIEMDKNRFEQEIVYYLEKLDITEEKVRLEQHSQYFLQSMKEDHFDKGKQLKFISQEMGREINTIGSKANHHQIQRIVVGMKDELEKIKEQLANVL